MMKIDEKTVIAYLAAQTKPREFNDIVRALEWHGNEDMTRADKGRLKTILSTTRKIQCNRSGQYSVSHQDLKAAPSPFTTETRKIAAAPPPVVAKAAPVAAAEAPATVKAAKPAYIDFGAVIKDSYQKKMPNIGVVRKEGQSFFFEPVRDPSNRYPVANGSAAFREGSVAIADDMRQASNAVRLREVIGHVDDPTIVTDITIREHNLRTEFSAAAMARTEEILAEAEAEKERTGSRVSPDDTWHDETDLEILTIDPVYARDRDDAVWAEPTADGGWHKKTYIADVSRYVRPGDALDAEARARGTSVYFADRCVPMFPPELSGDLFSLQEGENRAAMCFEQWIDKAGKVLKSSDPYRAVINVKANLSYEQVMATRFGTWDAQTAPVKERIDALFGAFDAMKHVRNAREAMKIHLPKSEIFLGEKGLEIETNKSTDSHVLIEEFMLTAGEQAIATIEAKGAEGIYRNHPEPPSLEKIEEHRELFKSYGLRVPAEIKSADDFRVILDQAESLPEAERQIVSSIILPLLARAYYGIENIGHSGLNMPRYTQATSPVRRYPDDEIARALIAVCDLGPGGMTEERWKEQEQIAYESTQREFAAEMAERDAKPRYDAQKMQDFIGQTFDGTVIGLTNKGLRIRLNDNNIETLVPPESLTRKFRREAAANDNGFTPGESVRVTIATANKLTGRITVDLDKGIGSSPVPPQLLAGAAAGSSLNLPSL